MGCVEKREAMLMSYLFVEDKRFSSAPLAAYKN